MNGIKSKLLIICVILIATQGYTQVSPYNHPELDWFTFETEHFAVHFHEGVERTARTVAEIAEQIYEPITQLYCYEPDGRVHFIIKDYEDNSNGAAYYYDNKIEVWAMPMHFSLRGTHDWLRNVVTHEFSHIISLGASRKITRRIPAFYFQAIGRENERRPDVVLGYPDAIVSYPLAMTVVPMWYAEGMAQYHIAGLGYDTWDSHRDMLLRTAVLENALLTFDEMGVFGYNSVGNERVYNQGYSLVLYIAETFGQEKLGELCQAMRTKWRFTIDGAISHVLGRSAQQLYQEWRSYLQQRYEQQLAPVRADSIEGDLLVEEGIGNTCPVWSPTENQFVYIGTDDNDYLSQTALYLVRQGKKIKIKDRVQGFCSWSPDGNELAYARLRKYSHGSVYLDIHRYDVKHGRETRLTKGLRARSPNFSPDGSQIAFVVGVDGTDNLGLMLSDGSGVQFLTQNKNGEMIFGPRWSPDGKYIVYAQGEELGRDIVLYDVMQRTTRTILKTETDARDPVFSPDGNYLYFSWDRTGIFNIYRADSNGEHIEQITNVAGGAFMPSVNDDGDLLYSTFKADGYKIVRLDDCKPLAREVQIAHNPSPNEKINASHNNSSNERSNPALFSVKPYKMTYSNIMFLPRVMLDYGRVKVGTYFYSSDVLDRYSILGGAAINSKLDYETFGIFEFRRFAPTLFLELYAYSLHMDENIEILEGEPKVGVNVRFNIIEADIGFSYRFFNMLDLRTAFVHSRYTSKISDFYFQDIRWVSPDNTYFIGNHVECVIDYNGITPSIDSDIAPSSGRKINIKYHYELNDFFSDFSTDNKFGTLQEVYTDYNFHYLRLDWQEYFNIPTLNHSLGLRFRGGYIDRPVEDFFNLFAGGLDGMRGYPYFSIEGRKMLIGSIYYRFPILRNIKKRLLFITFDKIFGGIYADAGNAFNRDKIIFKKMKKDIGFELRVSAFSFYGYPTKFFFNAAYGFSEFKNESTKRDYGKEWRYYFGLAFDFFD